MAWSPTCLECSFTQFKTPCATHADKRYSKAPCAKCGAYKVTVDLEDESDGCGTYYDIKCEACGDAYRTDGPDS